MRSPFCSPSWNLLSDLCQTLTDYVRCYPGRQCRVKDEAEIFCRQAGHYGLSGREGERGVAYFRGLLRETDEKEFCFRGIEY